jgi:hypothetical protein
VTADNLDYRQQFISSIVASGPETFEDIFNAIIFSKEYLLNIERPKSFEENLMPLLDTLKWDPAANAGDVDESIFRRMTEFDSQMRLSGMGWDTMTYKIGRIPQVPLDGLSFANYHKALRERLLLNDCSYEGGCNGAGEGLLFDENDALLPSVEQMSPEDYVDYLFLSALHRKATAVEKTDLLALFDTLSHTSIVDDVTEVRSGRHDDIARITFDYISRLPEQYYFRAVN